MTNRYGTQAWAHWAAWRRNELQAMPDPEAFFQSLGERAAARIAELETAIAGNDLPREGYLDKLGRLRMARADAEAQVAREMLTPPPEPGHPDSETDEGPAGLGTGEWMPMVIPPEHPGYHDLDDDPGLNRGHQSDE